MRMHAGYNRRRLLVMSCVASLLGACASPAPVHYYTLVGPSPMQSTAIPAAGFDIDVLPVTVPAALRRQAMVLRTGAAQLMVQDNHQWAAPLPEALRAALSEDLVAALNTRDVAGLPMAATARGEGDTRPVYRVALVVRRLDAVYGSRVTLAGLWSLSTADGRTLLSCTGSATRPATGGYARLAEAAQGALAAVAVQIGAALRALPRAGCPAAAAGSKGNAG